jgi:hypothetical protein
VFIGKKFHGLIIKKKHPDKPGVFIKDL